MRNGFLGACLAVVLAQGLTGAVTWVRKLGGSGVERARALTVDRSGNTWVVGSTASTDFPVKDALQATSGGAGDAFIAKLDRQGGVIWATYLGGSAADEATRVEVDAAGNGCVTGTTHSSNFPTTADAYQRSLKGGSDAFLVRLNPAGQILYATFFGGTGDDSASALVLDAAGFTAVGGTTNATDLPTTPDAAFASTRGGTDAFVAIFNAAGQRVYATYFGGSGADTLASMALGQNGNLYLAGQTASTNLPVTANAPQPTLAGSTDAYLARLSADKKTFEYVSYIGGSAADTAVDVIVDFSEMVFVAGSTSSPNFPVFPAGSTPFHGGVSDAFLAQYSFTRAETEPGLAAVPKATRGASLKRALGLLDGGSRGSGVAVGPGGVATPISVAAFGTAGGNTQAVAVEPISGISFNLFINTTAIPNIQPLQGISTCRSSRFAAVANLGQLNPPDSPVYRCQYDDAVGEDYFSDADQDTYTCTQGGDALVINSDTDVTIPENFSHCEFASPCTEGEGGDPIATASGELFDDETDLSLGGPLPMTLARHYGSNLQTARYVRSALGTNWMHSFDQVILFDAPRTQAIVVLTRGRVVLFRRVGTNWVLQFGLPVQYQLANDATAFRFFDPSQRILYTFATAGQINRIEDVNGNAFTITQGPAGPTRVADGLGRTLDFTYSGAQLTRVMDNTGRTVDFTYTGANLGSATLPDGKRITYEYTTAGARTTLLTRRTLPEGNAHATQQYDARGRVTRQTDSRGNSMTFAYDTPTARFTQLTDPTGAVTLHRATNLNTLSQANDAHGNTTLLEYDFNGHRTGVQDGDGAVTGGVFNAMGSILSAAAADGSTTRFTYGTFAFSGFTFERPLTITHPDASTERFSYDTRGNLTTYTDRAGQASTFTYASRGLLATIRTPSGGTGAFEYNADGTRSTARLLTGETLRFEYDTARRVTRVIRGDNSSQRFAYDARDRVTSVTDGRGQVTTFTYDGNGRRTALRDPLQGQTRVAFDGDNRVTTVTDALNNVARRSYDPVGRLANTTDPTSVEVRRTYDKVGRVTALADAVGTFVSFTRSAEGVVTGMTNGASQTFKIASDARQRPIAITDPAGSQTSIAWNNMDRITSITDALGNVARAVYDSAGRLQRRVGREGETTQFGYNADSRINQITDPRGNASKLDRDGAGRITALTDPAGLVTRFEYNARGRRSKVTRPDNSTASFTYDENGRLTRADYSDTTRIDYARDNLGRITSANGVTLKYDAAGRVTESNGIRNEYDAAGRLAAIFFDATRFIRYTYNNRGLLTRITDWTGRIWEFEYDSARRITRARAPNGVVSTYSYGADARVASLRHAGNGADYAVALTRDAVGRVTAVAGNAPAPSLTAATQEFVYSSNDRIQGREYDGRGNMTRDGDRRFTFDVRNKLTRVTAPGVDVIIEYDAFGYPTRVGDRLYVWNYATFPPLLAAARPRSSAPASAARAAAGDSPFDLSVFVFAPEPVESTFIAPQQDRIPIQLGFGILAVNGSDQNGVLQTGHSLPGSQVNFTEKGEAAGTITFSAGLGSIQISPPAVDLFVFGDTGETLIPIAGAQVALSANTGETIDAISREPLRRPSVIRLTKEVEDLRALQEQAVFSGNLDLANDLAAKIELDERLIRVFSATFRDDGGGLNHFRDFRRSLPNTDTSAEFDEPLEDPTIEVLEFTADYRNEPLSDIETLIPPGIDLYQRGTAQVVVGLFGVIAGAFLDLADERIRESVAACKVQGAAAGSTDQSTLLTTKPPTGQCILKFANTQTNVL